jgi:excisionase family DNA binding protein
MDSHYLTVKVAAKVLGRTERTVYNYIKRGYLESVRFGDSVYVVRESLIKNTKPSTK